MCNLVLVFVLICCVLWDKLWLGFVSVLVIILVYIFLIKMEFVVILFYMVVFVMCYEMIWIKSKIIFEISLSIMLDIYYESYLVFLVVGVGLMLVFGLLYKLWWYVFWRNKMKINLMVILVKCGDLKFI